MQSTCESRKCLSASWVSRMERASRCYWKKISREIPARSLVSSDTFDSVRWFRKYDATSRYGPFGAPPSLKSSPQAGIHISRPYMRHRCCMIYQRNEKKGEKRRKRNHWSNRTCNMGATYIRIKLSSPNLFSLNNYFSRKV